MPKIKVVELDGGKTELEANISRRGGSKRIGHFRKNAKTRECFTCKEEIALGEGIGVIFGLSSATSFPVSFNLLSFSCWWHWLEDPLRLAYGGHIGYTNTRHIVSFLGTVVNLGTYNNKLKWQGKHHFCGYRLGRRIYSSVIEQSFG